MNIGQGKVLSDAAGWRLDHSLCLNLSMQSVFQFSWPEYLFSTFNLSTKVCVEQRAGSAGWVKKCSGFGFRKASSKAIDGPSLTGVIILMSNEVIFYFLDAVNSALLLAFRTLGKIFTVVRSDETE